MERLAGGYSLSPTDGSVKFALARYNTAGILDASFGNNGIDTISFPGSTFSKIQSVLVQSDGKILVGGFNTNTGPFDYYFALVRYNTNGTLDNSFGLVLTTVYGNCIAYSMAIQSDGKILEAGEEETVDPSIQNFAMVRYLPGGALDNAFGINGVDTTNFGNENSSQANAIQLINSRIYLAGTTGSTWAIAAYLNDAGALPVALLNFDGVLRNNEALLNWSTGNEFNNKGFEVQKSMDGQTFTDIGFVEGAGNSSAINNYNYTDVKVLSGSNYYRLKQIDIDDRFIYSPVIKLDYSKFDWSVSGNPVNNNSWMQLQLDKSSNVSVQIISTNGSIIQTINKGNIIAGTYSIPLNMGNITPGIYILRLRVNDQTFAKKIIK